MISTKLPQKAVPPGYQVCPKCNGKGGKKYKVYDVSSILTGIARLKKGQSLRDVSDPVRWMIFPCFLCEETGNVDWVTIVTKGNLKNAFSDYEGCLITFDDSLLFDTQNYYDGKSKFKNLENLIESSRKRYDGPLKLNMSILDKDAETLLKIVEEIDYFWEEIFYNPPFEDYVNNWLAANGLSQYKPDKYVYPKTHDYPF